MGKKSDFISKMIEESYFLQSIEKFKQIEKRANFYDIAIDIVKDYPIQASVIILAVWNVGNFRFVKNREEFLFQLKNTFKVCEPLFKELDGLDFRNINFDEKKGVIEKIYTELAKINGVGYTGATKVMHLINPNVFVIWDSYISGQKPKKYYKDLEIVKNGWEYKKYNRDADGYIDFNKDMQIVFKDIKFNGNERTFAKAIDEFNYVNITLPIQKILNIRIQ